MKGHFPSILIGFSIILLCSCIKKNDIYDDQVLNSQKIQAFEIAFPNTEKEVAEYPNGFAVQVTPEGQYVWQGDIILSPEQVKIFSKSGSTRGAIINNARKQWSSNTVIYKFHSSVPQLMKDFVNDAADEWMRYSELAFYEYSTLGGSKPNYILIKAGTDGSYSNLGMIGGEQILSLDLNSANKGTAMHEFGHTIGLIHEQCRSDRDDYITINYNNIRPSWKSQFDKESANHNKTSSFDFNSIMLYGSWAGSSVVYDTTIPMMTRKDGTIWWQQRSYISEQDMRAVGSIYGIPYFSNTIKV